MKKKYSNSFPYYPSHIWRLSVRKNHSHEEKKLVHFSLSLELSCSEQVPRNGALKSR
jgi:hypothetical protein